MVEVGLSTVIPDSNLMYKTLEGAGADASCIVIMAVERLL